MTNGEFIEILKEKGYSYEIEGDKIVVTHNGHVELYFLETIPPGVVFKNGGDVRLDSLETLSPDMVFNNGGDVNLNSLETLPPGVQFNNKGYVDFGSLKTIPPGVVFNNKEEVYLAPLVEMYSDFSNWSGNIEGIDSKRLLNLMISKGMFI